MSITTAAELWRMSATQLAEAIRSRQVSSQDVIGPVRGNIARIWSRAKKAVGEVVPPDLHFHELRHAGNRFAAFWGQYSRADGSATTGWVLLGCRSTHSAHTAGCGPSSRTGCRRQDVCGRHLIAGEALPDRLVLAGLAVDIGETALRL